MNIDDMISSYVNSLEKNHKKSYGIYYTKKEICKYVVDTFVKADPNIRILEPGCGCGYFALELFRKLKKALDPIDAESILNDHLILIDNDIRALQLLSKLLKVNTSLFLNKSFLLHLDLQPDSFDYVIGNPPYAAKLSSEERRFCSRMFPRFSKSPKRFESSAIFLKRSIDLLRPGGTLVFVLPATILRVHSYNLLRNYVKKTCFIREILDIRRAFDDVGYETTIIILEKKNTNTDTHPELVITKTDIDDLDCSRFVTRECDYAFFESMKIFPLFINKKDQSLIQRIEENTVRLRNIAIMPRGAHINASNESISDVPKTGYIPILFGRDIGKYQIHNPRKFLKWPMKKFWKLRQRHLREKLLVQNLAYKIVAAYDSNGFLVNDTINTVFMRDGAFPPFYVLAILNSSVINYYFQKAITNRARLNIHMDHFYLGEIPIKKAPFEERKTLAEMAKEFLSFPSPQKRTKIENKVCEIYQIERDEVEYMESSVLKGKRNL